MRRHPDEDLDLRRREFLIRSGRYLGATVLASALGPGALYPQASSSADRSTSSPQLHVHPHYRTARPLDSLLLKVEPARDEFRSEQYAEELGRLLRRWTDSVKRSLNVEALASILSPGFRGGSFHPTSTTTLRQDKWLEARRLQFPAELALNASEFLKEWQQSLSTFDKLLTFECQIIRIDPRPDNGAAESILTEIWWEVVGAGKNFHREQRVGQWEVEWASRPGGQAPNYAISGWRTTAEVRSRATSRCFVDIAKTAFANNSSFVDQLSHGADYWRTVLDAASGIDIYGHNGVTLGDIDGDGNDDFYICQGAGLPNRLYRNRGDGTFEDITQSSGLGVLENTACALIVDVDNDGNQDVIVVCASGPQLYRNLGGGKFRKQPNAFHFANPPQGTFTGAAVADYDRDGWLDVYFCLYVYYQGAEQYKYPLPYYDAENGPPNFLFKNNRDGTFRDVTEQAGLNQGNTRYSFCCGWSDYDRDGWPDLYVVNDFGRKTLYRNNRNGTFEDVSKQAGVEDTGAGMSVCWLDYDNDGAEDLYVANMWTAAGLRITDEPAFQKSAPTPVRRLYQKHAMGNSLYRNRTNGAFSDETVHAEVGRGGWSWSSDSWDFDHDGYADLYVTNGMVSGPSRENLNSFFWRQVVANSPLDAKPTAAYEQGWNAINELLRADGTWSGFERNIFYANNRDGTFSDVSGALGLDFIEDGRSFALSDFDGDGRQEVFLKNRNAPQVRVLKNVIDGLSPAVAFRLRGTKSNRDAIGAVVTIQTEEGRQTRSLQAGTGFLAQHSKEIFFGLGNSKGIVRATIHWPSGFVQEIHDLPPNHRIWIEEASPHPKIEAFRPVETGSSTLNSDTTEELPKHVQSWLLAPITAPDFALTDIDGKEHRLSSYKGRPVILHFWTSESNDSAETLKSLNGVSAKCLAVRVGDHDESKPAISNSSDHQVEVLLGNTDTAAVYNILWSYLFDRHRDLPLPTTFLLNSNQEIEKVYTGGIAAEFIERDLQSIPRDLKDRLSKALPFPGVIEDADFRHNYLSYGSLYYQRGYFEQARASFERALADDPESAEALYGLGSSMLELSNVTGARQNFERATKAKAGYPDTLPNAWNNLGLLATREGRMEDAVGYFQRALEINPNHLVALDNLGNAYRRLRLWADAQRVFQHTVEIAPEDAEGHYGLGMVYAQNGDSDVALRELQKALAIRPDYPEALNNLGVLFLNLHRVDDAIRTFQSCIQVAPAFNQSYLNLAKVYALEGKSSEAREVLQQFLAQHSGDEEAKKLLEQLPR